MSFLTDFADQALVLPLVVLVGLAFVVVGWRRGAVAWMLAVAATFGVILVSKLTAFAWTGMLPPEIGLSNPSGHTAAAAVVYGGLLSLLAPHRWWTRWLAPVAAALAASVVGGTRLALNVHSLLDVLMGAAAGIAGAALLAQLAGQPPRGLRRALPLAVSVGVVILLHGTHSHAEDGIRRLSYLFRLPTQSSPGGRPGKIVALLPALPSETPHGGTPLLR